MTMTKGDLKTGMFGYFDDEKDDLFVIAGDTFVYEGGCVDFVSELNDALEMPSGRKITALYEGKCFNQVREDRAKLIWKRSEKEEAVATEPTPPVGTGEGAIQITESQFFEAVKKANETFMGIGKEKMPDDGVVNAMMGLQNILFGELIGSVLFDKEID